MGMPDFQLDGRLECRQEGVVLLEPWEGLPTSGWWMRVIRLRCLLNRAGLSMLALRAIFRHWLARLCCRPAISCEETQATPTHTCQIAEDRRSLNAGASRHLPALDSSLVYAALRSVV